MDNIELSQVQQEAVDKAMHWIENPKGKQVFYLAGVAGVGKSTLIKYIADKIDGYVVYGAFTGKAASVMREKGCPGASTIHSLIYIARVVDDKLVFELNPDSDVGEASLVVIDECSMVGEVLGRDLEYFGTPILVIGDPAQLPPVKSAGYFTNREPDVLLTEIHRQALGNPIIEASMKVRNGESLQLGSYGPELNIIRSRDLEAHHMATADQILCGMNKTRRSLNKQFRLAQGITDPMPTIGEKLICLKNAEKGIYLNGTMWRVLNCRDIGDKVKLRLEPDDRFMDLGEGKEYPEVSVLKEFFLGKEDTIPQAERIHLKHEFDYGYCVTCHKSQGSQWSNILLFDESYVFREDRYKWLYTGLTRAAKSITVVK